MKETLWLWVQVLWPASQRYKYKKNKVGQHKNIFVVTLNKKAEKFEFVREQDPTQQDYYND